MREPSTTEKMGVVFVIVTAMALIVNAIYWLGGGNFERGETLAFTEIFALLIFVCVFMVLGIAALDKGNT